MADSEFDARALERLRRVGGEKLVLKMASIFYKNGPQRVQTAIEGEQNRDMEAVQRAVHSLKSSAGNLGAVAVQDLADAIERMTEENRWDGMSGHLKDLKTAYERAEIWLKEKEEGLEP